MNIGHMNARLLHVLVFGCSGVSRSPPTWAPAWQLNLHNKNKMHMCQHTIAGSVIFPLSTGSIRTTDLAKNNRILAPSVSWKRNIWSPKKNDFQVLFVHQWQHPQRLHWNSCWSCCSVRRTSLQTWKHVRQILRDEAFTSRWCWAYLHYLRKRMQPSLMPPTVAGPSLLDESAHKHQHLLCSPRKLHEVKPSEGKHRRRHRWRLALALLVNICHSLHYSVSASRTRCLLSVHWR